MTKKKIIIIMIMVAMCCAVAALVSVTYGGKVKPGSDGAELYVDRDDTADSVRVMVAEHLTALGKAGWKCLGAFTGRSFSPKTGHYVLREGDNVIDVYKMLSRGHQTPVKLVVRSVRTPELLAGRLAGQLMADSTEAASRSLTSHDDESIKQLVNRIIDSQISDGLFKDSPISFHDVEEIKKCFIYRLCMMYHARIKYPDMVKKN